MRVLIAAVLGFAAALTLSRSAAAEDKIKKASENVIQLEKDDESE